MRSLRATFFAMLLTASAALTGCTAGTATTPGTPMSLLWSSDDALISDITVAGNVALAFVAAGEGREQIVARDLRTGDELWRADTSPGWQAPGVAHYVPVLRHNGHWLTAYLGASGDDARASRPAVVDAETGEVAGDWPHFTPFSSYRPHTCDDTFCFRAAVKDKGFTNMSVNFLSWSLDFDHTSPLKPEGARMLSERVSAGLANDASDDTGGTGDDTSGDAQPTLAYTSTFSVLWSRPYADVFGPGSSSAGGWAWIDDEEESPLLIGLGGTPNEPFGDGPATLVRELSGDRIVSLDRESGDTVWAVDDVRLCSAGEESFSDPKVIVVCRIRSGSITLDWSGTETTNFEYSDLELELISIDPSTGKVLWSIDLGSDARNLDSEDSPRLVSKTSSLAYLDGVAHIVNFETGETTMASEGERMLCARDRDSSRVNGTDTDTDTDTDHAVDLGYVKLLGAHDPDTPSWYAAVDDFAVCNGLGKRVRASMTEELLTAAGFDPNEVVVLAGSTGMLAYGQPRGFAR